MYQQTPCSVLSPAEAPPELQPSAGYEDIETEITDEEFQAFNNSGDSLAHSGMSLEAEIDDRFIMGNNHFGILRSYSVLRSKSGYRSAGSFVYIHPYLKRTTGG